MAKEVVWRIPALQELDDICRYLAADDEDASERFVAEVWAASESLQTLTERGRRVPELHHPDYRELYPDRVEVAALLHGRRDFRSAWGARYLSSPPPGGP